MALPLRGQTTLHWQGGTLTFAAGETSKTIEVTVTGDDLDEVDETVLVVLSAPTNSSIESGKGTGTGTITDDDDPPTVSIASQSSAEGDSGSQYGANGGDAQCSE